MSALVEHFRSNAATSKRYPLPIGCEFLRVPGKWLATCGLGDADRVFPVLRVIGSGWLTFATVDRDGYTWCVHVPCRGATFQSQPGLLAQ